MLTDVSYFQARLGAVFSVAGAPPELGLALVLAEVEPSGNPQAFALTFQGPPAPELEQQTVELLRDGDAPLAIFLVPVARTAAGVQYHAVFNN
ncbi:hypothetical protein [Pseudoduganella sp.]|uniref:DUF6916 family protein n=1 Tax=Pseudoduganella sp. TaxID=1880898 RepID=UPI0035AF176B